MIESFLNNFLSPTIWDIVIMLSLIWHQKIFQDHLDLFEKVMKDVFELERKVNNTND